MNGPNLTIDYRCHESSGDVCFLIWALFLQLDFRMRYIYVFAKLFCWVNERAYPFESRTQRCSPLGTNSVIKFLHSYFMLMSLSFWYFPSLWCTLVYSHLIQFFNKSPDEEISEHVGIWAVIFDLNCWVWMLTMDKHK